MSGSNRITLQVEDGSRFRTVICGHARCNQDGVHQGSFPSKRSGPLISPWTSPSARRISTSTEESHPLNPLALLATILNDVFTFGIGGASLKFHCLFAYDAVQETYERAFIVVRMISPGHLFPLH